MLSKVIGYIIIYFSRGNSILGVGIVNFNKEQSLFEFIDLEIIKCKKDLLLVLTLTNKFHLLLGGYTKHYV